MSIEENQSPEREQTDESLRVEREKADDALGDRYGVDVVADAILVKARAAADAVLAKARATSDRKTQRGEPDARLAQLIDQERALEDLVIDHERADADEVVRIARAELTEHLSAERSVTDQFLSHERGRSDDAVAVRDDFLGIVSHDLRNMLGVIVGYAGLIADAEMEQGPAKIRMHAERIRRSGTRMNRLVGDLVDVASIQAGRLAVMPEPSDATVVLTEAVESFQAHATANGVALAMESASAPPLAPFDSARILQVLVNLLGNAIKFTPRGGKVTARVEGVDDDLRFAVSDTGPGIPPDKLESIFERFVQVTVDDRRGVGLGLYISKCIVQGHGGRIWAESKIGVGSTLLFTLPLGAASSAEIGR